MKTLGELMDTVEDLHPDLAAYLETEDGRFAMLRHPLIYDIPYHTMKNALHNERYRMILEDVERFTAAKAWSNIVWLHERPHRFGIYNDLKEKMHDRDRADILMSLWQDSENIWQNYQLWHDEWVWMRDSGYTPYLDDDEWDGETLALPDPLPVWRGMTDRATAEINDGMSWTTDKERGMWFARRYASLRRKGTPTLIEGTVSKSKILGVFHGRSESEIVAFPEDVNVIATHEVEAR